LRDYMPSMAYIKVRVRGRLGVSPMPTCPDKPGPNVGQTVGHFEVDDLDSVVGDLTGRGVVFEEYESPKTINFIAQIGPARGAWFKDPDGNVFGLREGSVPAVA
jgi:catechol 2,3-dioxygenase-like lactoylglutathione lyase family enzyme